METLKTGFIVVLLLAVLYGVYVVLNKDQTPPTAEIAWHQQQSEQELQIDLGSPTDPPLGTGSSMPAGNADPLSPSAPSPTPNGPSTSLGIPSVVTSELSPLPTSDSTELDMVPSGTASGGNPWPGSRPGSSGPGVSAPLLIPKADEPSVEAVTTPAEIPARPGDLSSLPALRHSASAWPEVESPASPVPAATTPKAPAAQPGAGGADVFSEPVSTPATLPETSSADTVTTDVQPTPSSVYSPNTDPQPSAATNARFAAAFEAALREAQTNLIEARWYQALFVLSQFYNSPDLTSQQHQELLDLLDPLAAKVVYSPDHLITDPHVVQRGESLAQIAAMNQVSPELLANINGLENPNLLIPGSKLKVLRGPFRAEVDLQKKELTLFAGQLYAGRFPVTLGRDPEPVPGEYRVLEKQPGHDYFGAAGQRIPANDPQNPFGAVWIGLDRELAIHASPQRGDGGSLGCISLSPLDAQDVYSILTPGSSVTIRQ